MERVWRFRRTAVVLPEANARAIWAKARRRRDLYVTNSAVMILDDLEEASPEAIGVLRIAWHTPQPTLATIVKIEWDPAALGEDDLWELLEEMVGVALERRVA